MDNTCQNRQRYGRLKGGAFMLFGLLLVLTGVAVLAIFGFLLMLPFIGLGAAYSRRTPNPDNVCTIA